MNMWTPTRIKRRKGDPGPWLEFMKQLFPIESDRSKVFKFCATLIARPDIKMKYGILLISESQGVGKGTLMEKVLAPLVGWSNVSVPSEKQLTDNSFQSWIARRRLILVHEIYAGNSKKAYNGLKSYVTDGSNGARLTVNEKHLCEYELSNWAHFVLSSNSEHALRLVKGDRRWFVPKVSMAKQEVNYWVALNDWFVNGGLEIIHQWACDYVAEHGHVGPGDEAPTSEAKDELIKVSRSEGMQMVLDLGEAAMNCKFFRDEAGKVVTTDEVQPVVVTDRAIHHWLATTRDLRKNDPNLESLSTIRGMLRQSGMVGVCEYKTIGVRYAAFANPAAVKAIDEVMKKAAEDEVLGSQKLQPFIRFPADVIKETPLDVVKSWLGG
jgi:hypothetical protein